MYVGYVFLCNMESLKDCVRQKLFTCSGESSKTIQEVAAGSVVFLLNTDSNTLIGPFTAPDSTRTGLEPGTWTEVEDTHSLSENIRVEWEDLHELKNAQGRFPFLKDIKSCKLSQLQTQELLDALGQGPLFSTKESSAPKRR
jgi:hypothetical protein